MSEPLIPNSKKKEENCSRCGGKGTIFETVEKKDSGVTIYQSRLCPWCQGTGKVKAKKKAPHN